MFLKQMKLTSFVQPAVGLLHKNIIKEFYLRQASELNQAETIVKNGTPAHGRRDLQHGGPLQPLLHPHHSVINIEKVEVEDFRFIYNKATVKLLWHFF